MRDARLEVLGACFGKHILIQPRDGSVDLLDNAAQVAHQRAAFASEIVNAGIARAVEVSVWLQKGFRRAGRHRDTDKAIAEQAGTADREFASLRNFHVIINLERNRDTVAFANETRPA